MFEHLQQRARKRSRVFRIDRSRFYTTSLIVGVLLAVAAHLYLSSCTDPDIGRLRCDVNLIRQQMATKQDMQEVRSSLMRLESDMHRMTEQLNQSR